MPDTKTAADAPSDVDYSGVYGSGDPALQEEARADAIERAGGEDAYLKNIDDVWTAQQGPRPATGQIAALGPQVFARSQLPDPAVARAAGIPPQQMTTAIVIDDLEEAASHPRGPEPGEIFRQAVNEVTNERMLQDAKETPNQAEHFNHTSEAVANARDNLQAETGQPGPAEPGDAGDGGGAASTGDAGNGAGAEEDVPPYSEWHKDDLVEECRNRELPHTGNKDDLVARLEEFDKNAE